MGFNRDYANNLFEVAEAYGYVKVRHMGVNFDNPDPHHIILTKKGLVFFANTNFVEQDTEKLNPTSVVNNIVNSTNVNIGDGNVSSITSNVPDKKELIKNQWIIGIGVTIISGIIIYIIKVYLNIDLS
ncbi:hypothetical protein [Sphingobacterium rhinopitheci]|uniref:hypothetical protein n=1 Tax=Sphingobacterium rhinopitheci TaxID=2781960 RepID=UPI001F51FFFF|nr:hypothetical protein [Sphingobacterium rhinopitheci]MCI0921223.1 hypothetical protein [Sphingobacterium rhinopitheci]